MSIILLLAGFASFSSGNGTMNLYSAKTLQRGNLAFNWHANFSGHEYSPGDTVDGTHQYLHLKAGLTGGFFDYFEVFGGLGFYGKRTYQGGFFNPDAAMNSAWFNSIYGGAKAYYPVIGEPFKNKRDPKWMVGVCGLLDWNPWESESDMDLANSIGRYSYFNRTIKHHTEIEANFLNDIEFYPFIIHLNAGYRWRGIPYSGFSQYAEDIRDLAIIGGGIEVVGGRFTRLLIEVKDKLPQTQENETDAGPDTLIGGMGIRLVAPDFFTFDLGVDYIFSQEDIDFVPDGYAGDLGKWRFKVGFSTKNVLLPRLKEKKEPEKGIIALTVNDVDTDEPLDALVNFRDTTVGIYKTGKNGNVKIELKPGIYHLELSKNGYITRKSSLTVKPGATVDINTVMRKKEEEKGIFSGTVSSYREAKPLRAKIELLGTDIPPIATDSVEGVFKKELPEGTYNVKVTADGYLPETFPVGIRKGETVVKNINLKEELKEEKKLILRGIHFASGKSTIPPDGYPILNKVAEVLKANKDVKVEIGGHTDAVGSASYNQQLSEQRARSVMNYLIQQGVSSDRLVARGYGESSPVASNTTRAGRAKNRRIEFTVISK